MTAQDIVSRIQQKLSSLGIAWRAQTVDSFKAGSPQTEVKAIATTGMATFDSIKRAAAAGRNFVITHEPTFWNHTDQTTSLEADAVYKAKQQFIKDNNLVLFRFHDHAHALKPDPLIVGSARMLGLTQYAAPTPSQPNLYVIPETTLRAFAADIEKRLDGHAIRVVGNPDMKVSKIMLGPGFSVPAPSPAFDVSIGGENAESGGVAEYALDSTALGQPKGVILLGHMLSEDWGMREVSEWLKGFITDVSIEWIPTTEPFTRI